MQDEISGGTTAVLALIFQNKLFVANVGDSRALLCREANEGTLSVEQVPVQTVVVLLELMMSSLGLYLASLISVFTQKLIEMP